ncbi:hypothetical protein BDZ45DRAFT_604404 [Acephala macrosclerotiorum]|nr:hypothetical protein BDZ45DRAFT_604404 [Acephala macrosclerotiorum]
MSDTSVTFGVSATTPLYLSHWAPSTTGQYAGTCIFIIALAAIFRGLLAFKAIQQRRWTDAEFNSREMVRAGRTKKEGDDAWRESDRKTLVLSANGVEENVIVVAKKVAKRAPWRLTVDLPRALLDTLIAFVGYLLMLAVMTTNVGYFFSVLGGTYLGSVILGRYKPLGDADGVGITH